MSEADFPNTQRPQKVAAFGCLVCRSLKTPQVWSQRVYGGYAYNPTDGSSQFGLNIHAWKLPVGEYEVGVLLFLQEHSKAPLSFGDSKAHRFRVRASLSPQEFNEKITTLRDKRLPDARYKAAHLEDCLHQVELTDAIWPAINELTDLEELNLSGMPVSDKMLDHLAPLPYLSSIRLDQTPIQGTALRGLSRLPALTELDISRIWLKKGQLTCVADLRRLRSLRMTHHVLNRHELCAVSNLSELQQLDLSYCVFEDGIPDSTFDEMASLKQLSLAASSIGNTDLREIAKLRGLEKLNLSGTAIGDAGVEHISGHTAMQFLDISKTSVSAHCLKSIATLSQLKMLVVDASLSIEQTIQELKDRGVTVDVLPSSQDEIARHWTNWK